MTKPHAVIFDFDGVIVDSYQVHLRSWAEAFRKIFQYPLPDCPAGELIGRSSRHIAETLSRLGNDPSQAENLLSAKLTILNHPDMIPPLLPGVQEIMSLLIRRNIPYAIASNAQKNYLKQVINHYQLPVTYYFGYEDYLRPKPDPEAYLFCSKKLGIELPENVLVFEDSVTGLEAAVSAGMTPIGITTGQSCEALLQAGAVCCYSSLLEAVQQSRLLI